MIIKVIFIVVAIVGIVSVFYVSWFWLMLIIPMIILLVIDLVLGLFKKKGD